MIDDVTDDELRAALAEVVQLDECEQEQFMRRLRHWIDAMSADDEAARFDSKHPTLLH